MPTRVAIHDLPRMLRELIDNAVRAAPDMVVSGAFSSDVSLQRAARGADLVVTGSSGNPVGQLEHVLGMLPQLGVVTVERNGRECALHGRGRSKELGELSPQGLLAAMRDFMAQGGGRGGGQ